MARDLVEHDPAGDGGCREDAVCDQNEMYGVVRKGGVILAR